MSQEDRRSQVWLQPSAGVKVSRIVSLSDDIALNWRRPIRIEALIPETAIGIGCQQRGKYGPPEGSAGTGEFVRHPSNLAFAVERIFQENRS